MWLKMLFSNDENLDLRRANSSNIDWFNLFPDTFALFSVSLDYLFLFLYTFFILIHLFIHSFVLFYIFYFLYFFFIYSDTRPSALDYGLFVHFCCIEVVVTFMPFWLSVQINFNCYFFTYSYKKIIAVMFIPLKDLGWDDLVIFGCKSVVKELLP